MGNDYITISLPKSMIEKIDVVIEESDLGYKSRPEFVKDAISRRFEDLEINCVEGLNSGG